mgnify:CR=1 FL=1
MNENKVIIYTANDGKTRIDVKLEEETLWLTQAQMCELYQTSKSNVSEHIKHIFEEGELNKESVVRNFRTTASDGKEYLVSHYNLDMVAPHFSLFFHDISRHSAGKDNKRHVLISPSFAWS